jgi:predicted dehydrogenase
LRSEGREALVRVLILGLSSIVQRRVLPALAAIGSVDAIDVASRSKAPPQGWAKAGRFYSDYAAAIAESEAELVYISLPNSDHLAWIEASLGSGKHVVADKPATLTLPQARRCVETAKRRSLLLAEATVFAYHPQISAMQRFADAHGPLTHIDAHFVIPPLPAENFRNFATLGGGCLNDMGPYAAAVARLFGQGKVASICAVPAPPRSDRDVDTGFSLLAAFDGGVRFSGHFSFESEYQNRLTLIAADGSVETERVFSPPADFAPLWQVRRKNASAAETLPAADAFRVFLEAVAASVESGRHDEFLANLLDDACFRNRVAQALGHGVEDQ